MKTRYRLIRRSSRGGMFYSVDTVTGYRTSLLTSNEDEARQLVEAKNNSHRQPTLNLQLARAYLTATDPAYMSRTWQNVMDEIQTHGKESTQKRGGPMPPAECRYGQPRTFPSPWWFSVKTGARQITPRVKFSRRSASTNG
jgi:hypothetical protein